MHSERVGAGSGRARRIGWWRAELALVREAPLEARYANYFEIGHTDLEFVLHFGQSYRKGAVPAIHTCVVTDPAYVRELIRLLEESLAAFELKHGAVPPRAERPDG